jgi:hypothetical protein
MAIDNTVGLFEAYREQKTEDRDIVLSGTIPEAIPDRFVEADDIKFLDKNIGAVHETLQQEDSPLDALIGPLEENATLAGFQAARCLARKPRARKWAAIYTLVNAEVSEDGPINQQLKRIGSDVEDDAIKRKYGLNTPVRED